MTPAEALKAFRAATQRLCEARAHQLIAESDCAHAVRGPLTGLTNFRSAYDRRKAAEGALEGAQLEFLQIEGILRSQDLIAMQDDADELAQAKADDHADRLADEYAMEPHL